MADLPTIQEINDSLISTEKLIRDRNALIKFYFKEDVYKDFLLAERLQDLAALESRDDRVDSQSVNLDKQETVQRSSYFQRFSNFLNPSDLPGRDIDPLPPITFDGDVNLDGKVDETDADAEDTESEKSGGWLDGLINLVTRRGGGAGGGATTKMASGGMIQPASPMIPQFAAGTNTTTNNTFAAPEDNAKVKSLKESGFEDGIKKNIENKFDTDFGIDPTLKKALAMGMALPLQVVAGRLMELISKTPIKSNEQKQDVTKSLSFISNAFGVPASSLENVPTDPKLLAKPGESTTASESSPGGSASKPVTSSSTGGGFKWNDPRTWGSIFNVFRGGQNNPPQPPPPTPPRPPGTGGPDTTNLTSAPIFQSSSSSTENYKNLISKNTTHTKSGISSVDSSTERPLDTVNPDPITSIINSLTASSSQTSTFSSTNSHVHSLLTNNITSMESRRPDLLEMTNNLEMQLSERRKEQATAMATSFGEASSGSPIAPPQPSGEDSLNSGSNRAGIEYEDSDFFDAYASTTQYV